MLKSPTPQLRGEWFYAMLPTMSAQSQIQAYDALTSLIYDTAIDQSLWPKLLEQVSESLHLLEEADVEKFLAQHFDRALHLNSQTNGQQTKNSALQDIINRLPIAVFVVKADASLFMSNELAQQLIDQKQITLNTCNELSSFSKNTTEKLHRIINNCSRDKQGGEYISVSKGESGSLSLWVSSTDTLHCEISDERLVTIYASPKQGNSVASIEMLMQAYSLTRTESRLLQALTGSSHNLAEAANSIGVKHHTARGYMKNIMLKTRTNSQPELLKLILTGPIPHADIKQTLQTSVSEPKPCLTIKLFDGRQLAYAEYGDPKGFSVIYCHALLGSRLECDFNTQALVHNNIRLIAPDRPGFGYSDSLPDRDPLLWYKDIEELTDQLGIDKFSVLTFSGGSLYGLILARAIPERIQQLSLVSNVGLNLTDKELESTRPFNRRMLKLARKRPSIFRLMLRIMSISLKHNITQYIEVNHGSLCESDHHIIESERFSTLKKSYAECIRQGTNEMAYEAISYTQHVDITLSDITVPTMIWQGREDHIAPLPIIQRVIHELPNSEANIIDHEGHYLLFTYWHEIIKQLKTS